MYTKCLWTAALIGVLSSPALAVRGHGAREAAKPLRTSKLTQSGARHWIYDPGNSPVAADVDGRPITKAMIEQKFLQIAPREQPPTDSTGIQTVLNLMVDKAYVAWLLDEKGYRLNPHEDSLYQSFRTTLLRNELHNQVMDRATKVTRDDVRHYWERQKVGYFVHAMAVKGDPQADSVAKALRGGADFAALSNAYNVDRATRGTGGTLSQPLSVGTMQAAMESLVVKMKPGDVTEPIPASEDGVFYLLRLDSLGARNAGDFEKAEPILYGRLSRARQLEFGDTYYDRFLKEANVHFNGTAVARVAERWDSLLSDVPEFDPHTGARKVDLTGRIPAFTPEERKMHLLESTWGPVTIGMMMSEIEGQEPMFRPKLRHGEDVEHYAQTMAMYPAIDRKAAAEHIGDMNYIKRELMERRELLLAQRMYTEEVEARSHVPLDSVKAYYNAHKADFVQPDKAKIAQIDLPDSAKAVEVLRKLQAGGDFTTLAKENTTDLLGKQNGGITDFFAAGEHDSLFDDVVFNRMKPGELLDHPLHHNGAWTLLKMIGKTGAYQLSFEESESLARENAEAFQQDRVFQKMLAGARRRHPLKLYPLVIRQVQLGHTPPYSQL